MIRLTRCCQASKAGTYFRNHLGTGDNQANPISPLPVLRSSWVGPALADVGLTIYSQPEAKHLVRLGRGLHPTKNIRLAPSANRKRAYYDVTISPPKTISLAALLCPSHPTATDIIDAHKVAVEAVVREVSTMLTGRRSDAPEIEKWMAALFTHTHTREGEPHLHSHAVLPNIARNEKGQWRAIKIDIAGQNRTRLELVYGNELARQLRRIGFTPHMAIRPNGLPEIMPLRPLVARFSTASRNILAAASAAEKEDPSSRKQSKWAGELHPRSGIPVPSHALSMMRRRTLANQLRRPKPKDADDPVRLRDEADRWTQALTNQEHRSLTRILDDLNILNPRRVRVLQTLPPPAALVVKAAYGRLDINERITPALLLRAAVAESAGQHPYEALQRACAASLEAQKAKAREIREKLLKRHHAATRSRLASQGQPTSGSLAARGDQSPAVTVASPAVVPAVALAQTSVSTPTTVPAPSRGRGRRGRR